MMDDVVVGSVGHDARPRLARRSRRPRPTRRRRAREHGGHRRADQPPGVDAPGARSAARSSAGRSVRSGSTIPLGKSSSYPSTEQTLSSLSTVVNAGGLGQVGDIVHNFSVAFSGHEAKRETCWAGLIASSACSISSVTTSSRRCKRSIGWPARCRLRTPCWTRRCASYRRRSDVLERERPRHDHCAGAARRLERRRDGAPSTTPRPTWSET